MLGRPFKDRSLALKACLGFRWPRAANAPETAHEPIAVTVEMHFRDMDITLFERVVTHQEGADVLQTVVADALAIAEGAGPARLQWHDDARELMLEQQLLQQPSVAAQVEEHQHQHE